MQPRDELFMRSLECYIGVYFSRYFATREIYTKIPHPLCERIFTYQLLLFRDIGYNESTKIIHVDTNITFTYTKCITVYQRNHVACIAYLA